MFLAFRAVDQTGRAFGELDKKMETLEEKQKAIARASYRLMFAGGALVAFSAMAGRALFGTLDSTTRGARALGDYEVAMKRVKKAFAEGIMDNFGPALEGMIDSMDELSKNDKFWDMMSGILIPITFIGAGIGLTMLAGGIVAKFMTALLTSLAAAGIIPAGAGIAGIATGLSLLLPIALTLMVIWAVYEFDILGLRTAAENFLDSAQAVVEDVSRKKNIGLDIAGWAGGKYGTEQLGLGTQQYLASMGDIPFRELNQHVYIEQYITQMDDETALNKFQDATINAIDDKQGTTTDGPP